MTSDNPRFSHALSIRGGGAVDAVDMSMACSMNTYNTDHNNQHTLISPRISFSNDFVLDSPGPSIKLDRSLKATTDPFAADFEFSPSLSPMAPADEVISKGRVLPLSGFQRMTLRDELEISDDVHVAQQSRPGRVSSRLKELLGLRKGVPTCASPEVQRNSLSQEIDREVSQMLQEEL